LLRTQPYDAIAPTSETTTLNGTDFKVAVQADLPPSSLGTNSVRLITVTVSWNDPGPVVHPCQLKAQLYLGKTP
jgi:hypothetical protein